MAYMKNFLIIIDSAPYGSVYGQEMIDLALAVAAFNQMVTLLFVNDGVYHLLAGQHPKQLGYKQYTEVYRALQFYEITHYCIAQTTLQHYLIDVSELMIEIKVVSDDDIDQLMRQADFVIKA